MKSVEFCYWLQGMFELSNPQQLDATQTDLIKRHLALVFKHEIDSSYGNQQHQAMLDKIHAGLTSPAVLTPVPHGAGSGDGGVLFRC